MPSKHHYAGGGKVKSVRDLQEALKLWKENKLPQEGFFSTLDELVATAPQDKMPAFQWQKYLQPGRKLNRDGIEFPLKQEELDYGNLANLDSSNYWKMMGQEISPDTQLSKDQLRTYVRHHRPGIELDVGTPTFTAGHDAFRARRGYGDSAEKLVELFPPHYDSDNLRHASDVPNSYEENITSSRDLPPYESHFSPWDISWSRTTRHNVPAHPVRNDPIPEGETDFGNHFDRARLIEEIQSDRHSAAGEKAFRPTPDEQAQLDALEKEAWGPAADFALGTEEQPNLHRHALPRPPRLVGQGPLGGEDPLFQKFVDLSTKAVRRAGYRSSDAEQEIAMREARVAPLSHKIADMQEAFRYKHENRGTREGFQSQEEKFEWQREMDVLRGQRDENTQQLAKLKRTPPDAPFKDPRDYATTEVRKQLLNSARENDRFLAMIRGEDQINRYEGGMDERRQAGMRKMYDELYPSVLRKEAGRYGAQPTDVSIMASDRLTGRPQTFIDLGSETMDDFVDKVSNGIYESGDTFKKASNDAVNLMDGLLDEFKDALENAPGYTDREQALRDIEAIEKKIDKGRKQLADLSDATDETDDATELESIFGQGGALHQIERWHADRWADLNMRNDNTSNHKLFPAVELTPEVHDRIKRVGVPIFSAAGAAALGYDALDEDDEHPTPAYAEGGPVSKQKRAIDYLRATADSLGHAIPFTSDDTQRRLSDKLARPLSGLASQVFSRDPDTQDLSLGLHPGILDEVAAMPTLSEDLGPLMDRLNPGMMMVPADVRAAMHRAPDWAHRAQERTTDNYKSARRGMGLDEPHGFVDNTLESLGVMSGQLPVPGAMVRKASKMLSPASRLGKIASRVGGAGMEWLTPTIEPKVGNYVKGAMFGGTTGGATDKVSDVVKQREQEDWISQAMEEVLKEDMRGTDADDDAAIASVGYAEGGKVSKLANMLKALNMSSDKKYMIGDPMEEALYAINEGTRTGTLDPTEALMFKQQIQSGDDDIVTDALLNLHEKLFPHPQVAPTVMQAPSTLRSVGPDPVNPYARGKSLSNDEWQAILADPQYNKPLNKATGGVVADPRGAPLSQDWYEHYGEGPEHMFLGDRTSKLPEGWTPTVAPPQPHGSNGGGGGSGATGLASLIALTRQGRNAYDAYGRLRGVYDRYFGTPPGAAEDIASEGAGNVSEMEGINDSELGNLSMPELAGAGAGAVGGLSALGGASAIPAGTVTISEGAALAGLEGGAAAGATGAGAGAAGGAGAGAGATGALGGGASADAAGMAAGTTAGGLATGLGLAALPLAIYLGGGFANDRRARDNLAQQQSGMEQVTLAGGQRALMLPDGTFIKDNQGMRDQIRDRWGTIPEDEFMTWLGTLPKESGSVRKLPQVNRSGRRTD